MNAKTIVVTVRNYDIKVVIHDFRKGNAGMPASLHHLGNPPEGDEVDYDVIDWAHGYQDGDGDLTKEEVAYEARTTISDDELVEAIIDELRR